jgi:hypothetical protein
MALPNIPSLSRIINTGSEGGREFSRLLNILLEKEHGNRLTTFSDESGDYKGVDSILDSNIGFQYKFYPSPLSASHKHSIKDSLANAILKFEGLNEWVLITPDEMQKADLAWFESLLHEFTEQKESGLKIIHRGHSFIVGLLENVPAIGYKYYPSSFSNRITEDVLKNEFQKLIENAFDKIKSYYPQTALDILNIIYKTSQDQITDRKFLARLNYVMGFALYETGKNKEGAEAMIKASTLDLMNQEYQIRAAKSYFNLGDFANAERMANEILSSNPNEYSCKALQFCFDVDKHTPQGIAALSDELLLSNQGLVIFYNFFSKKENQMFINYIIERYLKSPTEIIEINFDNKGKWKVLSFLIFSKIDAFHHFLTFGYVNPELSQNKDLKHCNYLLHEVVNTFQKTEIAKTINIHRFYLHYSNFLITQNKEDIVSMENLFSVQDENTEITIELLLRAYVQASLTKEALGLWEKMADKKKKEEYLPVVSYLLVEDNQIEQANKVATDYFLKEEFKVERGNIHIVFNYIKEILNDSDTRLEFIQELIQHDKFSSFLYQTFIEAYTALINDIETDVIAEIIDRVSAELVNASADEKSIAAMLYFNAKKHDKVVSLLRDSVNEQYPSDELRCYILSLFETGQEPTKMLSLFAKWRTNFPPNILIARVEFQALYFIEDWSTAIIVAEYYKDKFPNDKANALMMLLKAYYAQEEIGLAKIAFDELIKCINNWGQIKSLIPYGIGLKKTVDVLELIFKYAIDENNIAARQTFFSVIAVIQDEIVGLNDEILIGREGVVVYYKIDNQPSNMLIRKDNNFSMQFVGKSVNDSFTSFQKLTGFLQNIKILGYVHKFIWLGEVIMQSSQHNMNPTSEIHTIDFPDSTIDSFEKKMVEQFGPIEDQRQKRSDEILQLYYQGKESLSNVIRGCFSHSPIDAIYTLFYSSGYYFLALPEKNFQIHAGNSVGVQFVLDFSSLFILYELSKEKINFSEKFVISSQIISILEEQLDQLSTYKQPKMSIKISSKGVIPYFYDEGFIKRRIDHITGILNWTKANCKTIILPRKLEFRKALQNSPDKYSEYEYYIFDTAIIASEAGYVLLTEDLFLIKMLDIRYVLSSSVFLKLKLDDAKLNMAKAALIERKVVGLSVNEDLLYDAYLTSLSGKNIFWTSLLNLKPDIVFDPLVIATAIRFIKKFMIEALISENEKKRIATEIFKIYLSGFILSESQLQLFNSTVVHIIKDNFKLLPLLEPIVIGCYYDAATIRGSKPLVH